MNNENLPAKIDEETGEVLEPVVEDEDTIKTHLPFQPLSENEVIKHMINSPFLKEFVYTVQGKQDISAVGAREIANMFGYQTTETQYAESADGQSWIGTVLVMDPYTGSKRTGIREEPKKNNQHALTNAIYKAERSAINHLTPKRVRENIIHAYNKKIKGR